MEWQSRASSGSTLRVYINSGADAGYDPPDNNMFSLHADWSNGDFKLDWSDRAGSSDSDVTTNVVVQDVWQHYCMMKSVGSDEIVGYIDGLLVSRLTPSDPPCSIAKIQLLNSSGSVVVREFSMRSAAAAYPVIPYSPGDVTFRANIGNSQLRWNSMML